MERLIHRASYGISDWSDLTIIGPRGCEQHAPDAAVVIEAPFNLIGFIFLGYLAAIKSCWKGGYGLVLGGSGLTGPLLFLLKKTFRLKTAVFIHGLDIVVANALYQRVFFPCVNSSDLIIANSQNTKRLATARGAPKGNITVINPGTELPDLTSIMKRDDFCRHFNIPFKKILLFTGRITRRKGLSDFIAICLPAILDRVPDAGLVVVGDNPDDSLNRQGEAARVRRLVVENSLSKSVRFLGRITDAELPGAYAAADLHVFPIIEIDGDVEGFGMVAIEAAACQTPTIAFDEGGVADAISNSSGILIEAGNYDKFTSIICKELLESTFSGEAISIHARNFSWEKFNNRLKQTLLSLLDAN